MHLSKQYKRHRTINISLFLIIQADLKVVNDAKGGTVYRDHLPLLGEQGPGRTGLHRFVVGDQVSFNYINNKMIFI